MVFLPSQIISGQLSEFFLNQEILAQAVKDPDVLEQIQNAFNGFVESGQVWALVIGLLVGYMFRAFTSY